MVFWGDGLVYGVEVFLLVIVEVIGLWVVGLYVGFDYCMEQWVVVGFWCGYVDWVVVVMVVVGIDVLGFCFVEVWQVVEVVLVFEVWFFGLVVEVQGVVVDVVYVVDQ